MVIKWIIAFLLIFLGSVNRAANKQDISVDNTAIESEKYDVNDQTNATSVSQNLKCVCCPVHKNGMC